MNPENSWKNFINTGRIEYYLEYKNLQNAKDNKNADNNGCNSTEGERRG